MNFNMDPMQLLILMSKNDPQVAKIVDSISKGTSPQQVFYDLCKSKGVNPKDVINQLNNN